MRRIALLDDTRTASCHAAMVLLGGSVLIGPALHGNLVVSLLPLQIVDVFVTCCCCMLLGARSYPEGGDEGYYSKFPPEEVRCTKHNVQHAEKVCGKFKWQRCWCKGAESSVVPEFPVATSCCGWKVLRRHSSLLHRRTL